MSLVRAGLEFVDLRGQDEVTLGQSIDLVCPDRDLGVAPAKTNVRMMSLLFSEVTDAIYEFLRLTEVRESITLFQMMTVHYFPTIQLRQELRDFFFVQRRHTTATRHTFFQ